jgi:putative redox protein
VRKREIYECSCHPSKYVPEECDIVKLYANARLVDNYRIDVDDGRHVVCLDLDQEAGGTDMGPSALELALMSFVGCYSAIFMLTAHKMRATIEYLKVHAEAVKTDQAGTITDTKVDITTKTNLPEDRVRRLHELTVKGCPVGRLFEKAGVKIVYNVNIKKT